MESIRNSSTNHSLSTENISNSGILAKLRRLKIDEGLISKSIKSVKTYHEESEITDPNENYDEKYFFTKLKKWYIELKNLFEDVKVNTSSHDNLKLVDLDDVKKDVLELDTKIKNFKLYLQSELMTLKIDEEEIFQQVNHNKTEINKIKRKPSMAIATKPFNHIVPSPVRVLIHSPFKCPEVQEFQEFMINSKNSSGGWVLYNHNIFVKYWHKYFWADSESYQEIQEADINNSVNFQLFISDLFKNIPDLTIKDLIAHVQWYSKFLYLKERQQRALDKWKTNKTIIKKSRRNTQTLQNNKLTKSKSVIKHCTFIEMVDKDTLSTFVSDELKVLKSRYSNQIYSDILEVKHDNDDPMSLIEVVADTVFQDTVNDQEKSTVKANIFLQKSQSTAQTQNRLRYLKPTRQWENRCYIKKESIPQYTSVESITRLRIPDWRLGLQESMLD